MSTSEKIQIDVVLNERVVMTLYTCAVPSIGHSFILGFKPGARIIKAREVLWNNDNMGIYSAWIQVLCDDTGEVVTS